MGNFPASLFHFPCISMVSDTNTF